MTYLKPLDSLRAIAVILVILSHWFGSTHFLNKYTSILDGVDIFFVLSGFLITGILLNKRIEAEGLNRTTSSIFKNFYTRRTLRIFPIYYLTIGLLYLIGDYTGTSIRQNIFYFLTYTSNFYFYQNGWDGVISHFWSLAVEEQFYLVWPWVILWTPNQHLLKAILMTILLGVLGQIFFSDIHTLACFDGLGLGALMAWAMIKRPDLLSKAENPLTWIAISSLVFQVVRVASSGELMPIPSRTLTALITIWAINVVIQKKHSGYLLIKLLGLPPLMAMGRISYGIYVYHLILPAFTGKVFKAINTQSGSSFFNYDNYSIHVINFVLLLLAAFYSYKWIEKPFLQLKNRFDYLPIEYQVRGKAFVK